MPGKHHADSHFSPWIVASVLILLAGLAVGGILLAREFGGRESPAPPDPSTAPVSLPAQTAGPASSPASAPTPEPAPTPGPIPDNGADGYLSEGVYIWNDMGFELFFGYDEAAEPYAQAIDSFAQSLPADVKVYNMVVPNHSEYALPERIQDSLGCGSQQENARYIYSTFSYATPVDICGTLDQHKAEYLYFNTDTHWTALGAYYAYETFCQVADVPQTPLELFKPAGYEGFCGYLYGLTGEDCLSRNPDRIDLYEPGYPYTAWVSDDGADFSQMDGVNSSDSSMGYSMFLRGDQPCVYIENENSYLNRKLAVVKDSYGNAIGAFLGASFDGVYLIDFQSFAGSLPDFVREHGVTDVLFLNSAVSANTYQRVEELRSLFPE